MSTYLWRYYLEDDIDNFRQYLAAVSHPGAYRRSSVGGTLGGGIAGSPGRGLATSPYLKTKNKAERGWGTAGKGKGPAVTSLSRGDANVKDSHGVTLIHLIASSAKENAFSFAQTLLELPLLDLYVQDQESGWTPLHRALYFGNVTIARALMNRDYRDIHGNGSHAGQGALFKIKDREGNSPFDVYGATIAARTLPHNARQTAIAAGSNSDDDESASGATGDEDIGGRREHNLSFIDIEGDELFMFGSNKNLTLGFGDEDDRQFPERVTLKRPEHLLQRLNAEHRAHSRSCNKGPISTDQYGHDVPQDGTLRALVRYKAIGIQDVQLSKLHTAILTCDPEANLYVCGFGPGGRLGTGDESTRFNFTCIYGGGLLGKRVTGIALGQNHTIALTSEGEVFTWGSNVFGQLGYAVQGLRDEDPVQLLPRQIFASLKRERALGCAASRIHSVVFSNNSLYTFGKNEGQLGLVDSDARSLDVQNTPRKVAASLFSSAIIMVSAIDKATVCLLENYEVWIFANYGYSKMIFPLDGFSNYFLRSTFMSTRYDSRPNHIAKICSGGDTICAMSREGDVFTVTVSQKLDPSPAANVSTTNPAKIRGALSAPHRVWSLRKDQMAVTDVDVGQDGSVIICTKSGSVWRRVKRTTVKDANTVSGATEYRTKDYKFSRVPGLTRVAAVRSNAFGAFAAVRRDCDVLRTQINVAANTLWSDVFPLLVFHGLSYEEDSDDEAPALRFWTSKSKRQNPAGIRQAVIMSKDLEGDLASLFAAGNAITDSGYDLTVGSTAFDIRIPCHEFILAGRSSVMRQGLSSFRKSYFFSISEVLTIEYDRAGKGLVLFQGLDILTVLNLVFYLYTDGVLDVWHYARHAPNLAHRYRQVRSELMRAASALQLHDLERATRLMIEPSKTLHQDLDSSILWPSFFESADVEIELDGTSAMVHSALVCQRCPFFEGLFHGRSGGGWLTSRYDQAREPQEVVKVDMRHVNRETFGLVLRHLYADTGVELFDNVCTPDLDLFLDLIMDVMSVANELMLDRLVQVCQKVLGCYVNARNVCQLLNAVAPCSVTEFKDVALEYVCLNLEGMLENYLLDELDEDLILELDNVVRQNQLAYLPYVRSGRAEALLHEAYPELGELLEKAKRRKIDSMSLRLRLHEGETKDPKAGKSPALGPKSPMLKAGGSTNDLMFDLDEEGDEHPRRTSVGRATPGRARSIPDENRQSPLSTPPAGGIWVGTGRKAFSPASPSAAISSLNELTWPGLEETKSPRSPSETVTEKARTIPWANAPLQSGKLNMKQIMAQASESRTSNISAGLSRQAVIAGAVKAGPGTKLSQKERKKQMQQQVRMQQQWQEAAPPAAAAVPQARPSPWRTPPTGTKVSLKDVLDRPRDASPSSALGRRESSPSPAAALTLRQTVPGNVATRKPPSAQIAGQPSRQQRSVSSPAVAGGLDLAARKSRRSSGSPSIAPRYTKHDSMPVEPPIQLSMADILAQQQTEKDMIREAAARRSLQEIQEEQAFQEWWDQEEAATRARMVEEEEEVGGQEAGAGKARGPGRGGRGRGKDGGSRGRGRGGRRGGNEVRAASGAGGDSERGRRGRAPRT